MSSWAAIALGAGAAFVGVPLLYLAFDKVIVPLGDWWVSR